MNILSHLMASPVYECCAMNGLPVTQSVADTSKINCAGVGDRQVWWW